MELRKEYQEVLDAVTRAYPIDVIVYTRYFFEKAIEKCQALADRPRVQLTDSEIDALWDAHWIAKSVDGYEMSRSIIAAYDAKQLQPIEVPFDYEKWSQGGWQAIGDNGRLCHVIEPEFTYTMRKV